MLNIRSRAGWSNGAACVVLGLCAANAVAQSPPSMVVSGTEQAARDTDAMRILRDELAREMRLVEEQTKRKAERLLARDNQGAQESEDASVRHAQNIQALRREIEQATHRAATGSGGRGSPVPASTTRRSTGVVTVTADAQAPPWWDVYGRAPQRSDLATTRVNGAAVAGATVVAPAR